jgi:hypothetical protein
MRIRLCLPMLAVVLIPTAAGAHFHDWDASGAGSVTRGSTLVGLHASVARVLPPPSRRDTSPLSVVGDVSIHWGSGDVTQFTLLSGLRHTFAQKREQRWLPFAHALLGFVHARTRGAGDTDPALGFGAGIDRVLGDSDWGVRAQLDYIVRPGDIAPRFSAGFVKHFNSK